MIRHELRLTWRYMIGMMGGKVRSMVILTIVMVVAAFAIGIPMGLASRLLTTGRMDKAWPFMVTVADGAALFVFTLMLAQSLSMATIVFYDRGDLDLLLTAPLKPGRILMVRTLAMVANAMWGFLAFVAPFLICSAVIGGHWGWLAGFPMIMAFSLLATALGVAGATLLSGMIGPRRTRTVAQIIGVFVGASMFLVAESYNIMGRTQGAIFYKQMFDWIRAHPGNHLVQFPARAAMGEPVPLLLLVGFCVAAFLAIMAWLGRGFADSAAAAAGAAEQRFKVRSTRRSSGFRAGLTRVMIFKELKLLGRDPTLLSQVLLQVIYFVVMGVILFRNLGHGHTMTNDAAYIGGAAMMTFLSSQIACGLGWLTISAEDAPELLICAPITQQQAAKAKVLAVVIPVSVAVAIPALLIGVYSPWAGLCAYAGALAAATAMAFIELWNQKPAKRSQFRMRRRGSGSTLLYFIEMGIGALIAGAVGLAAAGKDFSLFALIPAALATAAIFAMKKDKWLND